MLSTNLLRRSPETIVRSLERRGEDGAVVAELARTDEQWRQALSELEDLRAQRNEASRAIGDLMKSGAREEADARKEEVRVLGERLKSLEDEARSLETSFRDTMLTVPNIVSDAVPDGEDETGNVVVREEGEQRSYDFELKPHWELSESLGVTDFERGAKLSGRMFYALGEAGARLQRAVVQWMIDLHRERHGYEERGVPFLVLGQTLVNSSNLPKFADALYHDAEEDLWLIPTAEVPLTSLHADEILPPGSLPIKYMAHTPCFRRERAAAGSQVRGLKRLHQFEKVEMYQFVEPEQSPAALDELVEHASGHRARARATVPHPPTVQWGPRVRVHVELRRGDMDARQRGVAGGELLLQLHGLPGAARQYPLPEGAWGAARPGAHAQRLRPGAAARAHRAAGDVPAAGRLRPPAGRARAVHGWPADARPPVTPAVARMRALR